MVEDSLQQVETDIGSGEVDLSTIYKNGDDDN